MSACGRCGGAGQVVDVQVNEDGHVSVVTVTCPACAGTGQQP